MRLHLLPLLLLAAGCGCSDATASRPDEASGRPASSWLPADPGARTPPADDPGVDAPPPAPPADDPRPPPPQGGSGRPPRPPQPDPAAEEVGACEPGLLPFCDADRLVTCTRTDEGAQLLATTCEGGCEERSCYLGGCTSWCEPGERWCAGGQRRRECAESLDRFSDAGERCLDEVLTEPCPDGTFCSRGACVPSCDRVECGECPIEEELACGANGSVYWNPCLRACAGQQPGEGCTIGTLEPVAQFPGAWAAAIVEGPPRLLLTLALVDRPSETFRWSARPLDGFVAGEERYATDEAPVGVVHSTPLGDGTTLLIGRMFDAHGGVAGPDGYRETFRFPLQVGSTSENIGVWTGSWPWLIGVAGKLWAIDPALPQMPVLISAQVRSGEPNDDFLTFGHLADPDRVFLGAVNGERIDLWDIDARPGGYVRLDGPGYSQLLWRGAPADVWQLRGLAFWRGAGRAGIVVNEHRPSGYGSVFDYRREDGCMVLQARLGTGPEDIGSLRGVDLDGDGVDEVVVTGQGRTRVFGHDGQGRLVLRAVGPGPASYLVAVRAMDGDGDGINELWTSDHELPPEGGTLVLRLVP